MNSKFGFISFTMKKNALNYQQIFRNCLVLQTCSIKDLDVLINCEHHFHRRFYPWHVTKVLGVKSSNHIFLLRFGYAIFCFYRLCTRI
jgi:hypothetical protein